MTMAGAYPDGTRINVCPEGARLFEAWLKRGEDVFDNPEGRAYWQHRDACPECTKRKEKGE